MTEAVDVVMATVQNLGVGEGPILNKGEKIRLGTEDKVFHPRKLKKVIVLGMGMSLWDYISESYGNPPEPDCEIWTINYAGFVFKSHVCFNLHDFDGSDQPEHKEIFEKYSRWPDMKVVSIKSYPEYANVYEYPLQEVMEDCMGAVPYFTNSTAYVIAYALLCRVEQLFLYGCDFDYDKAFIDVGDKTEHGRSCLEFWLGRASAFQCVLTVAAHSTLLGMSEVAKHGRIPFYGYAGYQPQFEIVPGVGPKLVGFDKPIPAVEAALAQGGEPGTDNVVQLQAAQ